jgi:hypothetical protein
MSLLLLSFAALAMGPLLLRFGGAARWLPSFLDGFVLVTLVGLVFAHVLPHSLELGGWVSLPLLAAGAALPGLVERVPAVRTPALRVVTWAFVLVGIAVHAFLDGTVLIEGPNGDAVERLLGVGVVLHRLPVGLAIWWLVKPRYGLWGAAVVCVLLVVFSSLGLFAGAPFVAGLAGRSLAWFQAFVAGGLLHVAMHGGAAPLAGTHRAAGIGALLGLVLLVVLTVMHAKHAGEGPDAEEAFVGLAFAMAPALLASLALAASLHLVAPVLAGRSSWLGRALRGFGEIFGGAFFVSWALLGPRWALLQGAMAVAVAAVVALRGNGGGAASEPGSALRRALTSDVDRNAAWLLVGLALAALLYALLPAHALVAVPAFVGVLVAVALAAPFYLSPLALAPVALVLLRAGLTPGAALALLVAAPLSMRAHAARGVGGVRARVFVLVAGLGVLVDLAFAGGASLPLVAAAPSWAEVASLVVVVGLGLGSLLRLGPRAFAAHVVHLHDHAGHAAPADPAQSTGIFTVA